MGCFNVHGFYSHLPIEGGDKIGVILCAKLDRRADLGMETISDGFFPIMAPVFGEYDEYGNIEDIIPTNTTKAFQELTGVDISEFFELIRDIASEDYGQVQKKLIPEYHGKYHEKLLKEDLKKAIEAKDKSKVEALVSTMNYDKEQEEKLKTATFLPIFEHEAILRQFIKTGHDHMNGEVYGITLDAEKSYDAIEKFITLVGKGTIFNPVAASFVEDTTITQLTLDGKFGEYYKIQTTALQHENLLLGNYIPSWDYFGAVYRNQNLNYATLKSEILEMIYLDCGLKFHGGMYGLSTYAGQEVMQKEILEMHETISKIVQKL